MSNQQPKPSDPSTLSPEQFEGYAKLAEEYAQQVFKLEHMNPSPVEALYGITLAFFITLQETSEPKYTEQQFRRTGTLLMLKHPLSKSFPYTNQQIIEAVLGQIAKDTPPPIPLAD